MYGAGYRTQGAEHSLDTEHIPQATGQTQGGWWRAESKVQGTGHKAQDTGHMTQDMAWSGMLETVPGAAHRTQQKYTVQSIAQGT